VAHLHPRLRSHVTVDRHSYRGEIWHVLKDPISGRQHRLNELGYAIVARLDGRLSVQEIWDLAVAEAGDAAPTQPEAIALLAQLHEGELIQTEAAPDVAEMFNSADRRKSRERKQRLNPLSMRVGLFDPTPWLNVLAPFAALILRRWAAWGWLALIIVTLTLLAPHTSELAAYGTQHLSTPRMLLILWLAYPVIKAIHEFAHALAVRVWGGDVHEMGVSLLVLMPVPYVDASSAAGFRERHRRVLVSLMGILAETTLAALAALVWLSVADGMLREAAFATMLIGGVSTLLFNGNPLLRFDAYYALADAIESPGLAPRSNAYWRHLLRRHLFGVANALPPAIAPGERRWLLGYGLAAGVYRVFVALLIVSWLVGLNLILGAMAALWFFTMMLARPAWKLLSYVKTAPELAERRGRAWAWGALAVVGPLALLFAMPLPDSTAADGVVWAPEQVQVRSEAEGFVERVYVRDGQQVAAGETIVQLSDPVLDTDLERVRARLRGLDVAYYNALFTVPAQANAVEQEIRRVQAERARVEARIASLSVRSAVAGRVAIAHAQDLPGLYLARGTLVAYVLAPAQASVRVVVTQADVARVQQRLGAIEVRLADAPATALRANLRAQTPAALRELPSAALGDRAGGTIVTDPTDPEGLRTLEPLFTFDLIVPQRALDRIGGRAWARFDHGSSPLAQQWLRRLQQLFIGALGP
ncbi:MAG: PqqD family peptide modification chaperone, partial [Burkholderiaceae bacterium]|nr:PqqD family peptide modification chaperone [Burkholderiaceae bacterium]